MFYPFLLLKAWLKALSSVFLLRVVLFVLPSVLLPDGVKDAEARNSSQILACLSKNQANAWTKVACPVVVVAVRGSSRCL
ncbi:MAG: hypothetical protein ACQEXC_08660 [Pseudomonadota bacterium]